MADIDMTDAPPVAKKKGGDSEGKKRFEVKKVWALPPNSSTLSQGALGDLRDKC